MNDIAQYSGVNNDIKSNYIQLVLGGEVQYKLLCAKQDRLKRFKKDLKEKFCYCPNLYFQIDKVLVDYFSISDYVLKAEYGIVLEILFRLNKFVRYSNAFDLSFLKKYVPLAFYIGLYKNRFNINSEKIDMVFTKILQYPFDPMFIDKWWIELFVKYENPKLLTANYERLNGIETEALMLILRGGKVRSFSGLPCNLSRKELYIIVNCFDDSFELKYDILHRAILMARTTIYDPSKLDFIKMFFRRIKSFNHDLNLFQNQISFWKSAYEFFCKNKVSIESLIDYIDYFENSVEVDSTFTLKGKTLNSVKVAIENWHEELAKKAEALKRPKVWGLESDSVVISVDNISYLFDEIIDSKTLQEEGSEMKHCVYAYLNDCINRRCRIFSMKRKKSTSIVRELTIEVSNNRIMQIKGKYNRSARVKEKQAIEQWKREIKLN